MHGDHSKLRTGPWPRIGGYIRFHSANKGCHVWINSITQAKQYDHVRYTHIICCINPNLKPKSKIHYQHMCVDIYQYKFKNICIYVPICSVHQRQQQQQQQQQQLLLLLLLLQQLQQLQLHNNYNYTTTTTKTTTSPQLQLQLQLGYSYTKIHDTNGHDTNYNYKYATLHYNHYTTLDYTTIHYSTLHYTRPITPLQYDCNYIALIALHHNYNSTMLQLRLQLQYTTLHPAVVGEVTTATIATTPTNTNPTTFLSTSGFALPSVIHNNQPLL